MDDKLNRVFSGRVVRKDLVRRVKVGANVPAFVLEFLLGKYCASADPLAIATNGGRYVFAALDQRTVGAQVRIPKTTAPFAELEALLQ